ncbi:MAG: alpha/beta hydrolase [Acidimicrobiia bacterium]|nr:alpha/beta hydrolase [Acidimicrobiia bacterium]
MRTVGPLLIGVGAVAGVLASDRLARRRWATNPDPLDGEEITFPADDELVVPTDDGAALRIVRAGAGPPVVLIHGLTSNADDWGPVARRLVDAGHRVIAMEQRGHGGSTVGSDGFGAARLGLDVRQVIDALDLHDVVLVGHSMGGISSMSFVIDHPGAAARRLVALGLVATVADTGRADRRAGLHAIALRPTTDLAARPYVGKGIARAVFGTRPNDRLLDAAVASGSRCPPATRHGAALALLDYDIRDRLAAISLPTTVVCGTRDLITPIGDNRAIADAIPGAELVSVPGAGHLVIWEAADIVAEAVAAHTRVTLG